MDPQFKKFKLNGNVYLWKYRDNTRSYPGWNITFDDQAIDSLLMLFELMDKSEFTSEVMIPVHKPKTNHLRIVNNGSQIKTVGKLILKHTKTLNSGWSIRELLDNLQLDFDPSYLEQLKKSLLKVKTNKGDFAICDSKESDESILYFW
jgi:hypothetical protein